MNLMTSLNGFYEFMIANTIKGRRTPKVSVNTARGRMVRVRRMLGWQHRIRQPQIPLEHLQLRTLIPSCGLTLDGEVDEDGMVKTLNEIDAFLDFLRNERKVGPGEELWYLDTLRHLADYLYHDQTVFLHMTFQDLPIRIKLREYAKEARQRRIQTPESADINKKWISWKDYLEVVKTLRAECHPIGKNNRRKSAQAIAASYKRYLIFAFLSAFPDRQRTIRELVYGKTLVKVNGVWLVRHEAKDFKTGKTFCRKSKLREVKLPEWLYPELEAWLVGYEDDSGNWQGFIDKNGRKTGWREAFEPEGDYVFVQKNGKPLSSSSVWDLFRSTTLRLTDQACNPHLVRNMVVTFVISQGVSDEVLQSLATLLAHSVETLMKIYDRRPLLDKAQPALDLLEKLAIEAGLGAVH